MNPAGCAPLGINGAGTFAVQIGPRLRDRFVAAICGHRTAGPVDVSLTISEAAGGQQWRRTIGGRRCTTTVTVAGTANRSRLIERRGPVELHFEHHTERFASRLRLTAWALRFGRCRLRMPTTLMPQIDCRTELVSSALHVAVSIHDWHGRTIVAYHGILR